MTFDDAPESTKTFFIFLLRISKVNKKARINNLDLLSMDDAFIADF
jgi:hypothetical protein